MRFPSLFSLVAAFLVAGNASASQLTISWDDNSSNESGFKIERSVNGGTFAVLASTAANVTSFVDTTVASGASYGYRVQAFNTVTVSSFSNVAQSTVPDATKAPAIITQPASQTITAGTSVSLKVVASGAPAPSYQWKKGSTPLAGQTSDTLNLTSVSTSHQGTYVCVVSNSAGSTTSAAAAVTVTAATSRPAFTVQPANADALLGQSVNFNVSVTGSPSPTLKWYKDGALISGAAGTSYSLSNVTTAHAGKYSVVATNSAGSTTSNLAALSVSGQKPVITTQPVARTVAVGQDVSFVAAASGIPAPTFQWMKNKVAIAGATSATLTLKGVTSAQVATYSVVATNSAGSTVSSDAKLALAESSGRVTQVIAQAVSSGWGNAALQMTFDVSGGSKSVLFRAIGPGLAQFTKATLLSDPTLTLSGGSLSLTNNNWAGTTLLKDTFARVGAFPLASTSKDAALLADLPARRYSAVLGGKATGKALAELYDADAPATTSQLSAFTVRGLVGKGGDALTVGFEISGDTPVRLLVRAVGPSLPHLQNLVKDPRLDLYKGDTLVRSNDNWAGNKTLVDLFKKVGAASLATASKDAAMEITLAPGIYSAVIAGVNGSIGLARLEVWVLP